MNSISINEFKKFNQKTKSKYGNKKTVVDGISFDSKKEADYYGKLLLLKKSGLVINFKRQVKYPIEINNMKICTYIADFVVTHSDGFTEVVDVKGFKDKVYRLKFKLMEAVLGITIKEV